MNELMAIALGGALGAVARYLVGETVTTQVGSVFPWGIFVVNVVGCFLIGMLFVLLAEQHQGAGIWRSLLMVGFLGAFTTFSTFSLQTLALIETGRWLTALAYSLASLLSCLVAVAFGVWITRQLSGEG